MADTSTGTAQRIAAGLPGSESSLGLQQPFEWSSLLDQKTRAHGNKGRVPPQQEVGEEVGLRSQEEFRRRQAVVVPHGGAGKEKEEQSILQEEHELHKQQEEHSHKQVNDQQQLVLQREQEEQQRRPEQVARDLQQAAEQQKEPHQGFRQQEQPEQHQAFRDSSHHEQPQPSLSGGFDMTQLLGRPEDRENSPLPVQQQMLPPLGAYFAQMNFAQMFPGIPSVVGAQGGAGAQNFAAGPTPDRSFARVDPDRAAMSSMSDGVLTATGQRALVDTLLGLSNGGAGTLPRIHSASDLTPLQQFQLQQQFQQHLLQHQLLQQAYLYQLPLGAGQYRHPAADASLPGAGSALPGAHLSPVHSASSTSSSMSSSSSVSSAATSLTSAAGEQAAAAMANAIRIPKPKVVPAHGDLQCMGSSRKTRQQCRNAALKEYVGKRPIYCAAHVMLDPESLYAKCGYDGGRPCCETVLKEFVYCFKHVSSLTSDLLKQGSPGLDVMLTLFKRCCELLVDLEGRSVGSSMEPPDLGDQRKKKLARKFKIIRKALKEVLIAHKKFDAATANSIKRQYRENADCDAVIKKANRDTDVVPPSASSSLDAAATLVLPLAKPRRNQSPLTLSAAELLASVAEAQPESRAAKRRAPSADAGGAADIAAGAPPTVRAKTEADSSPAISAGVS